MMIRCTSQLKLRKVWQSPLFRRMVVRSYSDHLSARSFRPLNGLAVTTVYSGRGAGICMELIPFSGPGAYAVFNVGRFLFLRDAATVS